MESRIQVLFDGWPLVYEPSGHAALHLWEILQFLPDEVEANLAFPGNPPDWFVPPPEINLHSADEANAPLSNLRWEQRTLPQLAGKLGIDLVHLTHTHPALFSGVPVVVSPTAIGEPAPGPGIANRLRSALGQGAMAGKAWALWPNDLPTPDDQSTRHLSPPLAAPDFIPNGELPGHADGLDLPETFILYHGSYSPEVRHTLFESWVWGAGALGGYYPLLLLGALDSDKELETQLNRYNFGAAAKILPSIPTSQVSDVYKRASALIHPEEEPPWGGPLRHALVGGVPIVTIDQARNNALVGSAAFTLPENDTRKLGASLITVIVEEEVAQKLSGAAREQSAAWDPEHYREALGRLYKNALTHSH